MPVFADELKRYGPEASRGPEAVAAGSVTRRDAEAYCRRLARQHYENFPVVSWMLPRRLHQHFYNVYAYCRWADDLADEVGDPARSLQLLEWWKHELGECYAGSARHPVFVSLQTTIRECQIPPEPFEDLLTAFSQDQRVREYGSFDELLEYCARSANPVGRLVLYVCGHATAANFEHADSVCTGLQLANFWQDIGRDWDKGRIYLPREDRERFGYQRCDFENRITTPEFLALMEFEVRRTRPFLAAIDSLVSALPAWLQVDVELFARGGQTILDRIEAVGYRVWDQRPVATQWDMLRLLVRAVMRVVLRKLYPH